MIFILKYTVMCNRLMGKTKNYGCRLLAAMMKDEIEKNCGGVLLRSGDNG